jgi:hypothetical protein
MLIATRDRRDIDDQTRHGSDVDKPETDPRGTWQRGAAARVRGVAWLGEQPLTAFMGRALIYQ